MVTFPPTPFYDLQLSNVHPFSSGGTTLYNGNPNAIQALYDSKPLIATHTYEYKQSVPIPILGSKPITNQDLA